MLAVRAARGGSHKEARHEAEGYAERFVTQTGWYPGKVGHFAGARDYVYTDGDSVKAFAEEFLEAAFPKACAASGG